MNTKKTRLNIWICHLVIIGVYFILTTGCAKENISFASVELVYSQLAKYPTTEAIISWITNENDGKAAGEHWELIFIAAFKSEDIVVQSLDPSGNVFHSYKLCYSN